MRIYVLQGLSVLLLVLAVVWFIFEPGFEPVITAVAGLVGLFSAEFMKPGSGDQDLSPKTSQEASTGAESGESARKSIVVLPFDNLSPDPDNAFFADGLTEEIIADLSKVRALKVISRTSAMAFKGTSKTVPAIAKELNVRFVLEGSVRREAESLRITAQLIDAGSDVHLWAEKYSGGLADVFDLQERLSRRIVDALKVELSPDEDRRLAARPLSDIQSHDIWLRARQHVLSLTPDGVRRGKELVEQGLALYPENALLHATLAWVHAVRWGSFVEGGEEGLALGKKHAERAMELNPDLPWSRFSTAILRLREADLQGFVDWGRRVLEAGDDSHTLAVLALYLAYSARIEAAKRYAAEAFSLDPLSWVTAHTVHHVDLYAGHAGSAFEGMSELADRLAPGEAWPSYEVGYAAVQAGLREEAQAWFNRSIEGGSDLYARWSRLLLRVMEGDVDGAEADLRDHTLSGVSGRVGYGSYLMGSCYAGIGNTEKAFEWLERSVDQWFTNYRFMGEFDPLLSPLRGTSRFDRLLRRARQKDSTLEL
jgi:TolB-like protein